MASSTGETRLHTSLRLLGAAWRFLRAHPPLLAMPGLGALCLAAAAAVVYLPVLELTPGWDARFTIALGTVLLAFPLTFITTFFNVGFLAMVLAVERGEEPSIRDGLRAARGRLRTILGWSVLAAGVGGLFGALQRLPGGEWVANIAGWLGGLAWGLATFFVVPVLALEGVGPVGAVRRSAATFKRRWGEAVVGDIALTFVLGLAMIPGFLLVGAGAIAIEDGSDLGGPILVTAGIVLLAPLVVLSSALTELFVMQLYREDAAGPFGEQDLRAAIKPKESA